MQEGPHVLLRGHGEGITVMLDEQAEFEVIKADLRKKVADARQFFDGANTHVSFRGRPLSEEEEQALLNIIFAETTLDVSFVLHEGFSPVNPSFVTNTAPAHLPANERMTAYHQGGLRSGQSIRYSGSIVLTGDANPGSEIIAAGSVIVLGALKGLVHAGCNGDTSCFVSALALMPTQLRIADIITYIPQERNKKRTPKPAWAYIQDGQVYIAPLVN